MRLIKKIAAIAGFILLMLFVFDVVSIVFIGKEGDNSSGGTPDISVDYRLPAFADCTQWNTKYTTNSLGLRNEDVGKKRQGEIRILCMGDSCTFGTQSWIGSVETYVKVFEKLINREYPSLKITAINGGVPGYSSLQGLGLLGVLLKEYSPDIVTVYYGWNDHWVDVFTDRQKTLLNRADACLNRSVIFSLMKRLLNKHGDSGRIIRYSRLWGLFKPGKNIRVSPAEYEENLTNMVKLCKALNVKIILFTAPSNPDKAVPGKNWFAEQPFYTFELHSRYNHIVRKVAAKEGVCIFDLDAMLNQKIDKNRIFDDFVHFNKAGHAIVASLFAEYIEKERLINKE
jgi:lysophospholipase L1-like esterase